MFPIAHKSFLIYHLVFNFSNISLTIISIIHIKCSSSEQKRRSQGYPPPPLPPPPIIFEDSHNVDIEKDSRIFSVCNPPPRSRPQTTPTPIFNFLTDQELKCLDKQDESLLKRSHIFFLFLCIFRPNSLND